MNSLDTEGFCRELRERKLPVKSVTALSHDEIFFEQYEEGYTKDSLHRMFSISKSFTAVAVGLLLDEGKIRLDDPIASYFPEFVPKDVHPWIAAMTIRNLLMMKTCHRRTTYKNDLNRNWVESFFITAPDHEPDTVFCYDTSAAHVLCALVEKLTGIAMLDYLKEKLPVLHLSEDSHMLQDPFGVSIGGSGLVCTVRDLIGFAGFIAHRGRLEGKEYLSGDYIDLITSDLTDTDGSAVNPGTYPGYGMQFWRTECNGYMAYGLGGQFILFFPDLSMQVIITADIPAGKRDREVLTCFFSHFHP